MMGKIKTVYHLMAAALLVVMLSVGCAPRAEQVTEEPEPTATNTRQPTDTPAPTETDTPEPTETDTPQPTDTDTPEPTETNTLAPASSGGSGSGGGSQPSNPQPSATSGSGQPAATSIPPTAVPAATEAPPPDTSGLGTFYLRSQTVNSATCAMSVWGNGIEFVVDAPATVPLQSGVYGWQAFLGIGQTAPDEMYLPPGGVCSFTCYDEYIEWFCR